MTQLRSSVEWLRPRLPGLAGYAVPFLLVLYLGLESGGYEQATRSQVGIVAWWVVLLGVAVGLLPVIRLTRPGWVLLAIMGGLVVWIALGTVAWTQSTERSVIELSRSVTLIGFLLALLLLQGKEGLRRSVAGLGAATVVIALVALASRFHPSWFEIGPFPANYPIARLNYPVGYWNGLATLMAIGIAVLLWASRSSRSAVGRSLAAAAIPLLVLATYLTASRGGAIEVAAAIAILFLATPGRLNLLVRALIPALFSVVLVWLIIKRPELRDNLGGPADSQGTQMIWLTGLVTAAGFGLAWLLDSRVLGRVTSSATSRSTARGLGLALAAVIGIALVAAVASGTVGDRWNEFKEPVDTNSATVERLGSVSSGERYEQWRSAVEAGESETLTGLGPGAYEYWWSRNGTNPGFVRDAHSLYLEGFAELGLPGLILTLSLVLFPIGIALRGAFRDEDDDRRPAFAAAAAGMVAFAVAAGIDWAWELTVLPVAFFILAAAVCGPDAGSPTGLLNVRRFRLSLALPARVGIGAAALIAIVLVAVPMVGNQRILDSQALYRDGDLNGSLAKAEDARNLMPWSADADIQTALLQAELKNGPAALAAARDAVEEDPLSWQSWYILYRIATAQDRADLVAEAEAKVTELNRNFRDK